MRLSVEKQKQQFTRDRSVSRPKTQESAINPVSLLGRGKPLAEPVLQKMNESFGMDFSNVVIYESPIVEEMGAEAASMGGHIAFAPGKYRPESTAGQALLGHELAHVAQQASGAATGTGFLNDASLESQADTQGMAAALGQSVSLPGPAPAIPAMSPGTAAPVQAKKPDRKKASQPPQPIPSLARAPTPQQIQEAPEVFEASLPLIAPELQTNPSNVQLTGNNVSSNYSKVLTGIGWRQENAAKHRADKAFDILYGTHAKYGQKLADTGYNTESFRKYYQDEIRPIGLPELVTRKDYAADVRRMSDIDYDFIDEMLTDPNTQKLLKAKYQGLSSLSPELKTAMGGESGVLGALLSDLQLRFTQPALSQLKGMTPVSKGLMSLSSSSNTALLNAAQGRDFNELSDEELAQAATTVNKDLLHKAGNGAENKSSVQYTDAARLRRHIGMMNKIRDIVTAPEQTQQAPQAPQYPTVRSVDELQFEEGTHSRPAYATMAPPEEVTTQSSYDETLAAIYHRIKNPEPGETPEDLSARKRAFAQLRTQQMAAQQQSASSPKKNKKWWQFWR